MTKANDRLFEALMIRKAAEKDKIRKAKLIIKHKEKKHMVRPRVALTKGVAHGEKIIIDLSGPDSDAFYLLKFAKKYALQFQLNWNAIHDEMTSGDYDNLVKVFEKHFGEFVTLIKFK